MKTFTFGINLSMLVFSTSGFSINNEPKQRCMDRSSFLQNALIKASSVSVVSSLLSTTSSPQPASAASHSKDIPQLGTKAPFFSLPSTLDSGKEVNLDQLSSSGKWTVLYFYPGAFTSGCTLEARGFQRDFLEYNSLNTQIVGVSVDSIEKNAQFCTEEKLDFTLLTDEGGKVSKAYGTALSIPGFGTFSNRQTYLIDPNGYIQFVFTDVESRVARHSSEVLDKLKELQG